MKLCWADKLAVMWAGFLIFFWSIMWLPDLSGYLAMVLSPDGIRAIAFLVVPPWLLLRGIRWTFGGTRVAR